MLWRVFCWIEAFFYNFTTPLFYAACWYLFVGHNVSVLGELFGPLLSPHALETMHSFDRHGADLSGLFGSFMFVHFVSFLYIRRHPDLDRARRLEKADLLFHSPRVYFGLGTRGAQRRAGR